MFTWRGFRQGQHKSRELSWDNPFCPQVRLTSFLSSTKPEGVSWRILVSFTWPPQLWDCCVALGLVQAWATAVLLGRAQGARAVAPTAEHRSCPCEEAQRRDSAWLWLFTTGSSAGKGPGAGSPSEKGLAVPEQVSKRAVTIGGRGSKALETCRWCFHVMGSVLQTPLAAFQCFSWSDKAAPLLLSFSHLLGSDLPGFSSACPPRPIKVSDSGLCRGIIQT